MWKDWLSLSKREQKGFIVLSALLFLLVVFYLSIPLILKDDTSKTDEQLLAWIDSTKKLNLRDNSMDSLFYFDPNTIKIFELEKLGVKGSALLNWLKFRETGKRFIRPSDISLIRALDTPLADTLIKYAVINPAKTHNIVLSQRNESKPAITTKNNATTQKSKEDIFSNPPFVIEINSADTSEFATIKGIGKVLSARIVSYRKALGGFYSTDQLKEVYGMPPQTIERNKEHFTVDTTLIRKININKASLRRLKSHPYIDFYLAKAIVEYRNNNYPVKNINEILSQKEVKKEARQKLSKYLTVK